MRRARIALFVLLTGAPALAAAGAGSAAHAAAQAFLERHARAFGGEARVTVEQPDARLRLAPCRQPLAAELAPGARAVGPTTVVVRCPGPEPWAVNLPARVEILGEVLITTRALARGVTLEPGDFERRRQDLARVAPGALTDPGQAAGQKLRYPLGPGAVLNAGMLEVAPVVRRGQTVTIVSGRGGLEVRARGEALGDGGRGQTVQVRNHQTRRVLSGTIEAPGLVRVEL